jgi:hypothetical protein
MKHFSEVTACVVDFGIFIHVARRLAKDFAKVYYCTPWESAFPKIAHAVVGDGYPDIQWVESLWDVHDKVDLFVFPDIGLSSLQEHLERDGHAVWGSRQADGLEARRGLFLKELKNTGLEVPQFQEVMGLSNLRVLLKDKTDKYIKVSTYRGDFETFHFRSMDQDQGTLDHWATVLGPIQEHLKFFVFEPIESQIEDGCDTWCIDGVWPERVMHAMECKDKSLLATFCKFSELPDPVRMVNEKMGPVLKKYGYRGFFSSEVRITEDGKGFFIDPTCRAASPVSQLQSEMIGNLGEVVWSGANGLCLSPEPTAQFGVQSIFKVCRDQWEVLEIPGEIQEHVKVSFSCLVDGKICVPPDPDGVEEIGWLTATGNSIQEAIDNLKEYQEQMPDGVCVQTDSLADLLKEAKVSQEAGFPLTTKEIPEPSVVLE